MEPKRVKTEGKNFLTASFPELSFFPDNLNDYDSLHKFSIQNRELFWSHIARSRLEWFEDFTEITTGKFTDEDFRLKWFIGGKINVSGKIYNLFVFNLNLAFIFFNLNKS